MVSRKIYTPYKKLVEELGLFQLDVYRVRGSAGKEGEHKEKGAEAPIVKDIIRVYDPATNKIVIIDLGGPRESLDLATYLERLVSALRKAEVPLPERKVAMLMEALSKKKAEPTAA